MKYLKIKNNGLLDIRLVALMGGTTKSKDTFKIGQFGTGLKYTLAYLVRNNLDFKIFVGTDEVQITTEIETIRDEKFEIICINGQRTSITTRMGEDWEAWMIVRELWCNALDEGGAEYEVTSDVQTHEECTTFYIQSDYLINGVVNEWDKYFIHNKEPMSECNTHSIYSGGESLRIYKQGVLIYQDTQRRALFSYDVKNASINELREFKGLAAAEIAHALSKANEKVASYFLENITEDHYEGDMDYEWFIPNWSDSWKNVIGNGKIIHHEALQTIQDRGITVDTDSLIVVPECVYKNLTKRFPGIGALRIASKVGEFYEKYDAETENIINQACAILDTCGYIVHPELKFIYGFFEDKNVQAKISIDDKVVMISNTLLNKSMFDVVSILIEENEHFNTGLSDETRAFQQHFIDLYTKALLTSNKVNL